MENEDYVRQRIHLLKMKRETFTLHITKLLTWLDENQMSNIDRSELRRKRDQLQKQFHSFDDDQSEREQYEHVGTVEAEGNSITEQYYVAMARANAKLDDLEQSTNAKVVLPGPSTSAMNDSRLQATFNGNYEDWPKFKEDFQRFLRANSDLSDTLKLQKLRSCLSESMKAAIDSYVGNDNKFKVVWEMLLAAYDVTYKFTLSHALLVVNTPDMLDDSTESIQNFIRQIEPHMRWLEIAAKSRTDIVRILLSSLAITKMGREARRRCENFLKDKEMHDINDILKYLKSHKFQSLTENSKPNNHEKPETGPQKRIMESSRSMRRSKSTSPPTKRRVLRGNCTFCNRQRHFPYFCPALKAMLPSARRAEIRKAGMCEICLRENHSAKECRTNGRCRTCQGKHRTWLHED